MSANEIRKYTFINVLLFLALTFISSAELTLEFEFYPPLTISGKKTKLSIF